MAMKNLAAKIFRQRLIIEGTMEQPIDRSAIEKYLMELGDVLRMHVLTRPVTHRSPKFGWSGWVHWETSGAHFYAWEKPTLFFSVDIYTCKRFTEKRAIAFTRAFFHAAKVAYKSV